MILTPDNYFSTEASQEYISVSQYKDFTGAGGRPACEAMALAKVRGEWEQEKTAALLVGSFVDSHFSGTLDIFKAKNPEIFLKTGKNSGQLRSEYRNAEDIISMLEDDPYFMQYLAGDKQVIFTGEICGAKWKGMVDSLDEGVRITDLKVVKSIRERFWSKEYDRKISFVEHWGYDTQAAIYQTLVEINTGKKLPFFIAAASKETVPDHEIIGFTQEDLDLRMRMVQVNVPRILELKAGRLEPFRCEECDYCRATKKLSHPVHYKALGN